MLKTNILSKKVYSNFLVKTGLRAFGTPTADCMEHLKRLGIHNEVVV